MESIGSNANKGRSSGFLFNSLIALLFPFPSSFHLSYPPSFLSASFSLPFFLTPLPSLFFLPISLPSFLPFLFLSFLYRSLPFFVFFFFFFLLYGTNGCGKGVRKRGKNYNLLKHAENLRDNKVIGPIPPITADLFPEQRRREGGGGKRKNRVGFKDCDGLLYIICRKLTRVSAMLKCLQIFVHRLLNSLSTQGPGARGSTLSGQSWTRATRVWECGMYAHVSTLGSPNIP